ncbi:alpha/beta hydrolase [Methanosphaerula palustris]|uniref:AB hydrolase-1 domain-containing protein n=1 Tax=Methanosphaerula palustris (strain ATCC BAA-1556 / DSM 19958 / E1-9c) TaxID=521011 RepID=B8GIJ9_METPE|nr:alpha/beta hydrolase [Methanosphaerula palustris]ACL16812.1 conserved hypothetical protein [Methanosphaerula palustris E1-9c]
MARLTIEEIFVPGTTCRIPGILIRPAEPTGAAVIVHGYGGNKEEQLGLGFRVANAGLAACVIDLRGHGSHPLPLDAGMRDDTEEVIRYLRSFGKVVAIGHSVGGRLALLSSADYHIALSPPLRETFDEETRERLKLVRSYRVRPHDTAALFEVLRQLPIRDPVHYAGKNSLILYGERDMPEIIADCSALARAGGPVFCIPGAFHNDIYLAEEAMTTISDRIREWFPGKDTTTPDRS